MWDDVRNFHWRLRTKARSTPPRWAVNAIMFPPVVLGGRSGFARTFRRLAPIAGWLAVGNRVRIGRGTRIMWRPPSRLAPVKAHGQSPTIKSSGTLSPSRSNQTARLCPGPNATGIHAARHPVMVGASRWLPAGCKCFRNIH